MNRHRRQRDPSPGIRNGRKDNTSQRKNHPGQGKSNTQASYGGQPIQIHKRANNLKPKSRQNNLPSQHQLRSKQKPLGTPASQKAIHEQVQLKNHQSRLKEQRSENKEPNIPTISLEKGNQSDKQSAGKDSINSFYSLANPQILTSDISRDSFIQRESEPQLYPNFNSSQKQTKDLSNLQYHCKASSSSFDQEFTFLRKPIKEHINFYIQTSNFIRKQNNLKHSESTVVDGNINCLSFISYSTSQIIRFEKDFDERQTPIETLSQKIVDNLVNKKINTLLFNIGVSKSGKSASMVGNTNSPGILQTVLKALPHCKLLSLEISKGEIYSFGQSDRVVLESKSATSLEFSFYQPYLVDQSNINSVLSYCNQENYDNSGEHESMVFIIEYEGTKVMLVDFKGGDSSHPTNGTQPNVNPCFKVIANSLFDFNPRVSSSYESSKILWLLSFFLRFEYDTNVLAHLNSQQSSENTLILQCLQKIQSYQPWKPAKMAFINRLPPYPNSNSQKSGKRQIHEDQSKAAQMKEDKRKQAYYSFLAQQGIPPARKLTMQDFTAETAQQKQAFWSKISQEKENFSKTQKQYYKDMQQFNVNQSKLNAYLQQQNYERSCNLQDQKRIQQRKLQKAKRKRDQYKFENRERIITRVAEKVEKTKMDIMCHTENTSLVDLQNLELKSQIEMENRQFEEAMNKVDGEMGFELNQTNVENQGLKQIESELQERLRSKKLLMQKLFTTPVKQQEGENGEPQNQQANLVSETGENQSKKKRWWPF